MADPQNIKQTLEITVPATEVEAETARVVESLQKKIRLPGFRPGKVPLDLIRSRYQNEIRKEVLEKLVPRHFYKRAEQEGLAVVGTPNVVSELKIEAGEPLKFTAEFEIVPTIELKEYKDVPVALGPGERVERFAQAADDHRLVLVDVGNAARCTLGRACRSLWKRPCHLAEYESESRFIFDGGTGTVSCPGISRYRRTRRTVPSYDATSSSYVTSRGSIATPRTGPPTRRLVPR